jgi:type IV pilus assembly protein PilB
LKSLKDIKCELQKHNLDNFHPVAFTHKSITLVMEYLNANTHEDIAIYLGELLSRNQILQGPVEGFLAVGCAIQDQEYIILSTKYGAYNTDEEMARSIIHEIGATDKFKQPSDINDALEAHFTKWLEERVTKGDELEDMPVDCLKSLGEEVMSQEAINTIGQPANDCSTEPINVFEIEDEIQIDKKLDLVPLPEKDDTQETEVVSDNLENEAVLAVNNDDVLEIENVNDDFEKQADVLPVSDIEKAPKDSDEAPAPNNSSSGTMRSKLSSKKSLADNLLASGLITQEQLADAQDKQKGAQKPLEEVIVELGFIPERILCEVSEIVFDCEAQTLAEKDIDDETCQLIPYDLANRHGVFPVRIEDEELFLAMSNPRNVLALDDIRQIMNYKIIPILCMATHISNMINEYYGATKEVYELLKNAKDVDIKIINTQSDNILMNGNSAPSEYKSLFDLESPTVKLVNLIFSDATKVQASNIYIEASQNFVETYYRVDGDMRNIMKIPGKFYPQLVARIKILANLDALEKSVYQEGHFNLDVNGSKVGFYISTTPNVFGEKISIRVLNTLDEKISISHLDLNSDDRNKLLEALKSPQGIVFVTGPDQSGKMETLYASLNTLKEGTTSIVTVESPIKVLHEGVRQFQLNLQNGETFADGLRSVLPQDPNVILLGSTPDKNTADIVIKTALTGHLVLSTLLANSAVGAITVLRDMGVENQQVASSVSLLLNQRLIKRICDSCKEEYVPTEEYIKMNNELIQRYGLNKLYHGRGCQDCNFTGYRGRVGVMEVMQITEALKNSINDGSSEDELLKQAREDGMSTLIENGIDKILKGVTTLDEVIKHLGNFKEVKQKDGSFVRIEGDGRVCGENKSELEEDVRKKPLILIVDDDESIRKVIAKYLEMADYDVIEATNGQEAIEKAYREKPDLIVTDVMMPIMNGFEATKVLRSKLETATIPIIMLTSKADNTSELEGLEAGADDYLTKPCDKDKLLARISILLKGKWF